MTPQEIKAELQARGYSIAMLAEVIGKSGALVGAVINKKLVALPTAKAIAKAIDKPVLEVFPDVPSYQTAARANRQDLRELKKQELKKQLSA